MAKSGIPWNRVALVVITPIRLYETDCHFCGCILLKGDNSPDLATFFSNNAYQRWKRVY